MKTLWLIPLALPLLAASPPNRQLSLGIPAEGGLSLPTTETNLAAGPKKPGYEPAPLPNRDLSGPKTPVASAEPSLSPTLFTTREQYRGDGFSRGSTAQSEQERRLRPAAGFSLHMPLQPQ